MPPILPSEIQDKSARDGLIYLKESALQEPHHELLTRENIARGPKRHFSVVRFVGQTESLGYTSALFQQGDEAHCVGMFEGDFSDGLPVLRSTKLVG
jgi:hypothetical protein